MPELEYLIIPAILIVALLYSSVGHGGASGYLALMAIAGFDPLSLRSSALLLNVFVAGIAFYQYNKSGYFNWRILLPFAIASVPMAFVGAGIEIDPGLYKKILGVCLLFAILKLSGLIGGSRGALRKLQFIPALLIGGALGFVSGIIGIGGGIILSPLLLLFRWSDIKTTAGVSALFIFVNSLSGLSGLYFTGFSFHPHILFWVIAAVVGGLAGSYIGSAKLGAGSLRIILLLVLTFASIKLLFI